MKVRVGFIGVGGMAETHLKNMTANEHATIVAMCDVVEERATQAAEKYGGVAYTDYRQMLEEVPLDAVFVCVPPFAHAQIEETAAEKGIHLFVEKPVGLDVNLTSEKAKVIEKAGLITSSGYALRYMENVDIAKAFLADKKIGFVRAYYLSGFVQTPWWRVKAKSGGQLVEQATHVADLMRYLVGEVTSVYAVMATRHLDDQPELDIADVSTASLRFESGAIGHIDNCCIQPDHRFGIEIQGLNFRLMYEGTTLTIIENEDRTSYSNGETDIFKKQDDTFIQAIVENQPQLIKSDFKDALKTLVLTVGANESADTGLPVML